MATNLALTFLALCLASCLAPGGAEAHACCRGEKFAIAAAETDGCCLDTDGLTAPASALPASAGMGGIVHTVQPSAPAAQFALPRVAASPPLILRV